MKIFVNAAKTSTELPRASAKYSTRKRAKRVTIIFAFACTTTATIH